MGYAETYVWQLQQENRWLREQLQMAMEQLDSLPIWHNSQMVGDRGQR